MKVTWNKKYFKFNVVIDLCNFLWQNNNRLRSKKIILESYQLYFICIIYFIYFLFFTDLFLICILCVLIVQSLTMSPALIFLYTISITNDLLFPTHGHNTNHIWDGNWHMEIANPKLWMIIIQHTRSKSLYNCQGEQC